LPSHEPAVGSSNLRAFALGKELSKRGWRVAICPKHLGFAPRMRIFHLFKPDLILIQKARHPLNRPELFPDTPCVFDLDDADFLGEQQKEPVTVCVKGCHSVIAGSRYIADWCRHYNDNVHIVWTGTPFSAEPYPPQKERPAIIAWASSVPAHQVKEAEFLLKIMAEVKRRGADFTLRLYADDGSEQYKALVERFRQIGCTVETLPSLPYAGFLNALNDVAVGLNPVVDLEGFSAGKSFGKVLGYLERGVPSINHSNVDHPLFFDHMHNGILADDVESWVSHIIALLNDPVLRENIAQAGRVSMQQRLSVTAFTDSVEAILRAVVEG
jgi:glycosyltransferase involved in cell wall biosynthesis